MMYGVGALPSCRFRSGLADGSGGKHMSGDGSTNFGSSSNAGPLLTVMKSSSLPKSVTTERSNHDRARNYIAHRRALRAHVRILHRLSVCAISVPLADVATLKGNKMQVTLDILRGFVTYLLVAGTSLAIMYFVLPCFGDISLTPAAKVRIITAMFGGGALLLFVVVIVLAFAFRHTPILPR